MKGLLFIVAILVAPGLAACAHQVSYVPGTKVPYTQSNKSVLDACEEYRLAVERGDADALMLMAHKQYWEDSGTPSGSDDYGIEGLRNVLLTRLQKASDIRYSCATSPSTSSARARCCRAAVDVDRRQLHDRQPRRPPGLTARPRTGSSEWDGHRWLFLSGVWRFRAMPASAGDGGDPEASRLLVGVGEHRRSRARRAGGPTITVPVRQRWRNPAGTVSAGEPHRDRHAISIQR
jgi:hypothetical protein